MHGISMFVTSPIHIPGEPAGRALPGDAATRRRRPRRRRCRGRRRHGWGLSQRPGDSMVRLDGLLGKILWKKW
jgi:hypothetical protein